MGRDFPQEAALHEEAEIVINGGQRNGRDPLLYRRVDLLGRVMSVGGDNRLVNNLALVRGSEAAPPGKIAKLLVSESHHHRARAG